MRPALIGLPSTQVRSSHRRVLLTLFAALFGASLVSSCARTDALRFGAPTEAPIDAPHSPGADDPFEPDGPPSTSPIDVQDAAAEDVPDAAGDPLTDGPETRDASDTAELRDDVTEPVREDCFNGIDDDGDGLVDCDDVEDCGHEPICNLEDPIVQISTGQRTCGVHASGAVTCWRSTVDYGPVPGEGIAKVSVGGDRACAISTAQRVVCWGLFEEIPSVVELPGAVVDLAISPWHHACAALADGTVWCWGTGGDGQLGDGLEIDSQVPVMAEGISAAVEVSVGTEHSCARESTGAVWCWGQNHTGRLGTGGTEAERVPTRVVGIEDAVQISAGAGHTCAVRADRTTWCWGRNNYGQLGIGRLGDRLSPTQVVALERARSVTAGMFHTCALARGRIPTCWGYNRQGQLGNPGVSDSDTPARVLGAPSAVSIDAGWTHACSLGGNGIVSCWGGNFEALPTPLCDDSLGLEFCGCSNGVDDDGDGDIDCDDSECAHDRACLGLECVSVSNVLPDAFSQRVYVDPLTRTNAHAGSCGGEGTAEVVFAWVSPATQRYAIRVVDGDADGLWIRRGRCDGAEAACRVGPRRLEVVMDLEPDDQLIIGVENPEVAFLEIVPVFGQ